MNVSVLINNYNYGVYISECIDSVLQQEFKDIEIVIVDDGSTDTSLEILKEYEKYKNIKIICKENRGQLSAFNEGLKKSTGELILFLDSDDCFDINYVSEVVAFYKNNPSCDFLTVGKKYIGEKSGCDQPKKQSAGYSFYSTLYKREWVGSVTSTVSMRRNILDRFMPLEPLEQEWRVRADDCLIWGASLVYAKKFHLDKPLVFYRIHSVNNFYGKKFDFDYHLRRELNIGRLFDEVKKKYSTRETPEIFVLEYLSKGKGISNFFYYLNILIDTPFSFKNKIKSLIKMLIKNGG